MKYTSVAAAQQIRPGCSPKVKKERVDEDAALGCPLLDDVASAASVPSREKVGTEVDGQTRRARQVADLA